MTATEAARPPVVRDTERRGVGRASGRNGVLSTGHPLATEAGLAVLRDGGNAVDAAVAAALVLSVVCPYAATLGGDAYLLIADPWSGDVAGLNGTGCAPAGATLDRLTGGIPRDGILSATVPGFVAALCDALDRFGSRSLADLTAPAIDLAEHGFEIHGYLARNARDRAELLARDRGASALFLPAGIPLAVGDRLVQPDLARTLHHLARDGAAAFYEGEIARGIEQAVHGAGGLLSAKDLASHRSLWQRPMSVPFYGHDVWTMPPNSYGPTLLLQLLALERDGIDRVDPDGAEFILRGLAARSAAYRQVGRFIADPAFAEKDVRAIVSAAVSGTAASAPAMPPEARDRCTTNVVVVDREGLAVSLIQSISAPWGSGVVLEGTGILFNNRLGGFSADPASLNVLAPAKRPAHTLAPCLVTREGRTRMAVGTPGTVGQTCTLAQILARRLACNQSVEAAIDAPRWSVDFQGKPVFEPELADSVSATVKDTLPEAHPMPRGWISFGSLKLVEVDEASREFVPTAYADDRRSAAAGAV